MNVLLIENSRLYVSFLTRLFNELGFETTTTDNTAKASELFSGGTFDLVCMNKYLKGTTAMEFVRELREESPAVPVLMLTSDRTPDTLRSALSSGVTEVIFKAPPPEMSERIWDFVNEYVKPQSKGRVLYVEDSAVESAAVRDLLKSMDLEVDHYSTAEEAIERLDRRDYDLVISDVMLGGEKNGIALVSHIRGLPEERARVPVLTITGFDEAARRLELLRAGTNDYIVKPVMKEELAVRVTNLITNKKLMDKVLEQQAQLYEQAITDPLTGCYNRRGFREFVDQYMASTRRRSETVSLLMIDLDHFKKINDDHGHVVGDRVLSAIGGLLNATCRQGDVVSRIGGEEFVIFLTNCPQKGALASARRVRAQVEKLRPEGLRLTASVGVTVIEPEDPMSIDQALNAADRAVYHAKKRGRNRVSFRRR